jgi:hypothetical protein
MSAQNQHYVPKFILRHFLSEPIKEQVSVYDKHTDRIFATSIKNIMAERRFNDFVVEDWIVSFEPIAGWIESQIVPFYKRLIDTRRLEHTPEERAALALLISFQFVRSKANRELVKGIEELLEQKVTSMGGSMNDIKGWEPLTEDNLKKQHLMGMREMVHEFALIIGEKDFLLAESGAGRGFYLGDSPVCLNNARDFGPRGNLGLSVPGIEIYMPLSSDLMLCAWCPSILRGIRYDLENGRKSREKDFLGLLMSGKISAAEMKERLEEFRALEGPAESLLSNFAAGLPFPSNDDNMDYYNSMQVSFAHRYVVCRRSDFKLAREHNKEFPYLRKGRHLSTA